MRPQSVLHHLISLSRTFSTNSFSKYQVTGDNASKVDLQYASWGRRGSDLVFVSDDNIYYKACVECNATRITETGGQTIANGVPDWLYEEEILSNNNAIYFSPRGTKMCYASFNDSTVDSLSFPIYADQMGDSKLFNIRYPRVSVHQRSLHHSFMSPLSTTAWKEQSHHPSVCRSLDSCNGARVNCTRHTAH